MKNLKFLVVEDEKLAQKVMAKHLEEYVVDFAETKEAALHKLQAADYDICFFDLMLGKKDNCSGLKLIPPAVSKGAYVVVMSSLDSEEIVNKAYESGCHDFYVKGNEEANISAVLARYQQKNASANAVTVFSEQFITDDPQTRSDILEVLKYARSSLPILILGQSGTGKTCLARLIHEHSGRAGQFIDINCSAYNQELLEAEIFGYKKGAFTGAYENRRGKLLEADKGTLFLDEIGAMSPDMQTKLLKAIEEKSFYPVGSDKKERSEFRVISATLEDLQKLLTEEKLRFDFFQRIHGFTIALKPLSQRKSDIFPLISAFTRTSKKLSFEKHARTLLLNHTWPGNIRELKRFIDVAAAGDGMITQDTVLRHTAQAMKTERQSDGFLAQEQYDCALAKGLNGAMEKFAYEVIKRSLLQHAGKKVKTLKELKISKRMLYSTLRKFEGKKDGIKI
ncbi:MAG: sigma-54-dependent Fis family transcriptional regulator [Elusimicrobia bacterium]|nr:sigma-54-dependent Fis family transcriptional regulator [Elusimicrobiota bacterium]